MVDQRSVHPRCSGAPSVSRHARNNKMLSRPYPKTCPDLRMNTCQGSKLARVTPNRKCRMGYRIRLVLCAERYAVDSIAITISHRMAAIQAFNMRCRSELKRVPDPPLL